MATLQELMAEVGLSDEQGHEKKASVAKPSTSEVDQALANLGLADSVSVKTASEKETKHGGTMGLADIYKQIMGDEQSESQEQEKVASGEAAPAEEGSEESTPTTALGEVVAGYFNAMVEPYFDKVAADLEVEAGQGEKPLAHATTGGSMTAALGKASDPHLPVNHSASGGHDLKVTTKGTSPYSLKEKALAKQILKRMSAEAVGEISD